MIVSVAATVTRRVVIHDGILRHVPSRLADCIPNIIGARASSLTQRVKHPSIDSEAVVKKVVEVRVGSGVIE